MDVHIDRRTIEAVSAENRIAELESEVARLTEQIECRDQRKMYVWFDQISYLAVAHAKSASKARELLLANDCIGESGDGSCPERDKARNTVMSTTPSIWLGENAEFALTDSAELREQEQHSERLEKRASKAEAERDQLSEENARLKTGDISEAYNAGEQKIVALLGAANARWADAQNRLAEIEVRAQQAAGRSDCGIMDCIDELECEVKLWKDRANAARSEAVEVAVVGWKRDIEDANAERDRLLADNVALREALEGIKCRCSHAVDSHCPDCREALEPVVNNGPLNDDQFDAVKAGDWYCKRCSDARIRSGRKHWFDRDLQRVVYQQCNRCAALTTPATAVALERVRKEAKIEAWLEAKALAEQLKHKTSAMAFAYQCECEAAELRGGE